MLLHTRESSLGLWTGANTQEIARTSRLVSRLTGYQVQPNKAIVSDEMLRAPTAFALESFDIEASSVRGPLARVSVRMPDGELAEGSFTGDGPIDAFFSALNAATGYEARLKEYHVSAVTGGRDALGEVTVLLELDDELASGQGVSTDILEASGHAYLRALSNALAVRARSSQAEPEVVAAPTP